MLLQIFLSQDIWNQECLFCAFRIPHTHKMQIIDKIYFSTYLMTKFGSTSNLFKERGVNICRKLSRECCHSNGNLEIYGFKQTFLSRFSEHEGCLAKFRVNI